MDKSKVNPVIVQNLDKIRLIYDAVGGSYGESPGVADSILALYPDPRGMSTEDIRYVHRFIWQHVIDYGYKPSTPYHNDCILCCACTHCSKCPADWGDGMACLSDQALYLTWLRAENIKDAQLYARQIRDIPFKTDVK